MLIITVIKKSKNKKKYALKVDMYNSFIRYPVNIHQFAINFI